jgi:hypothetical protein
MSNASLHSESDSLEESSALHERFTRRLQSALPAAVSAGRAVGFWTAVGLPVLYLPLLAHGLDGTQDVLVFLGLLLVHLVALFGGRNYAR